VSRIEVLESRSTASQRTQYSQNIGGVARVAKAVGHVVMVVLAKVKTGNNKVIF